MYPYHRFIQSYCHHGRIGVLIEFGLETWIVTQSEEFLAISRDLAMHVAASNPDSVEGMLRQPFVRDPAVTRIVRWDHEPQSPAPTSTPPRSPAVAIRPKRA